jgi:gamma-glutamylcyclotransferase (GGCT)/AIG2-like uncharacterized protein YtfP
MTLFVYGTLKRNHGNHYLCKNAKYLGEGWVYGNRYRELAVEIPEELILAKGTFDLENDNKIEQQFKNVEMKKPNDLKKWNKVFGEIYQFDNLNDLIPIERLEGRVKKYNYKWYERDLVIAELNGKYLPVWIYNIPQKEMPLWLI